MQVMKIMLCAKGNLQWICVSMREREIKEIVTYLQFAKECLTVGERKLNSWLWTKGSLFYLKNAWVDTSVAIALEHDFAKYARNKYGDAWILLYLENLSTHYNADVRRIYWEGKVYSCYYLP